MSPCLDEGSIRIRNAAVSVIIAFHEMSARLYDHTRQYGLCVNLSIYAVTTYSV